MKVQNKRIKKESQRNRNAFVSAALRFFDIVKELIKSEDLNVDVRMPRVYINYNTYKERMCDRLGNIDKNRAVKFLNGVRLYIEFVRANARGLVKSREDTPTQPPRGEEPKDTSHAEGDEALDNSEEMNRVENGFGALPEDYKLSFWVANTNGEPLYAGKCGRQSLGIWPTKVETLPHLKEFMSNDIK